MLKKGRSNRETKNRVCESEEIKEKEEKKKKEENQR